MRKLLPNSSIPKGSKLAYRVPVSCIQKGVLWAPERKEGANVESVTGCMCRIRCCWYQQKQTFRMPVRASPTTWLSRACCTVVKALRALVPKFSESLPAHFTLVLAARVFGLALLVRAGSTILAQRCDRCSEELR